MDTNKIVTTRRERLALVIKKRFGNKQSRLVEEIGINAGELSGLLRDRFFGEKKARSLEKALNLQPMWLDGLEDNTDSVVMEFAHVYEQATDQGRSILRDAISTVRNLFVERRQQQMPVVSDRRRSR